MTDRTLADARRWVAHGTHLCRDALVSLDEADFGQPSLLKGWTRKHLAAHLAANADAVGNLIRWARTGEPTPMYSSLEQRADDIEDGARKSASELTNWFDQSATALGSAMDGLTPAQWAAEVLTAQGRTVPASETPWMRAREVMIHAVDLGTGVGFADLPADFLTALVTDIVGKRSAAVDGPAVLVSPSDLDLSWTVAGAGDATEVTGSLAGLTAYLAGRADHDARGADGARAPDLPRWL